MISFPLWVSLGRTYTCHCLKASVVKYHNLLWHLGFSSSRKKCSPLLCCCQGWLYFKATVGKLSLAVKYWFDLPGDLQTFIYRRILLWKVKATGEKKKPKSTEITSGEECKHLSSIELERLENLACFSSKLPAFVVQLDLALVLLSRKVDQLCDSGNGCSLPELLSEILFANCLSPDSCSKT